MEAAELRIGNKVAYSGVVWEVESIGVNEIHNCPQCRLKGMIPVKYDLLKPIPLTEEWLLKFGFVRGTADDFKHLYIDLNSNALLYIYHDLVCICEDTCGSDPVALKHIKSVHQLQNLYWCLCGEELTTSASSTT